MPAPVDLYPRLGAAELRSLVARAKDPAYARRLHAITLIAEGHSRVDVAQRVGIGAAALRQWVHRYNHGGPGALKHAQTSGRPAKLSPEQREELQSIIGGTLDQRTWRLADIAEEIARQFDISYDLASVGRLMKSMGYQYAHGRWQKRRDEAKLPAKQPHSPAGLVSVDN